MKKIHPDTAAKNFAARCRKMAKNQKKFVLFVEADLAAMLASLNLTDTDASHLAYQTVAYSTTIPVRLGRKQADQFYHIHHNTYALLDFTIYIFFETRIMLLATRRSKMLVDIYSSIMLSMIPRYYLIHFSIPQRVSRKIIDQRLDEYEALMQKGYHPDELMRSLVQFMCRDFIGDPSSDVTAIIGAHQHLSLTSEVITLQKEVLDGIQKSILTLPYSMT